MDNEEKIEKLDKEIKELEIKKADKDKVNELLERRNRLKFPLLYSTGKEIKKGYGKFSKWADEKNKQMEEDMKKEIEVKEEKKEEKKDDVKEPKEETMYDKMFGETEATRDLSKELGV